MTPEMQFVQGIPTYPKVHALGHRAIRELFDGPIVIQEKLDGSQISFMRDGWGDLHIRSKSAKIYTDAPEKLFTKAVEYLVGVQGLLTPGLVYRGEYLARNRHNVLAYDRVPTNHIALFDVNDGLESYLPPEAVNAEAQRLGCESVIVLYQSNGETKHDMDWLASLLQTTSMLGGQRIEGIVIKNYLRWTADGHAMMGKYVSEAYKETHAGEWKAANPGSLALIEKLVYDYRTTARWEKAKQHLRERGELSDSPKDIPLLMKEVGMDTEIECRPAIQETLWKYAWPKIQRGITRGIAEWYKEQLARQQLEGEL